MRAPSYARYGVCLADRVHLSEYFRRKALHVHMGEHELDLIIQVLGSIILTISQGIDQLPLSDQFQKHTRRTCGIGHSWNLSSRITSATTQEL